jgi:hypothetical protein
MWFTPVWGYVHQPLRLLYYVLESYIHSLMCTKPQSQASHRTGDLRTEHQILLPKLGQGTEPTLYRAQSLNTHTFLGTKLLKTTCT